MEYITPTIIGVVGIAIGFFFDRLRKGSAYQGRDEILEQAKRDADNQRRNEEIAIKEDMLKLREKQEQKLEQLRDKVRDRERDVDKRKAQLQEQQNDITKKEQMLQATQIKLTERNKATDARQLKLDRLLSEEQEQLYKISGLSKDQASEQLLTRIERDLSDEVGARL